MKKETQQIERRGLPGGPNEIFTYTTGVFSTEGFRIDSPDVNNYQNVIPSGFITMKERDGSPLRKGPIHGIDNLGNEQIMYPGFDYQFPGNEVTETLLAKMGGGLLDKTIKCGNCGWQWKAADGGSDVMDCHKCGGKGLVKAQVGKETPKLNVAKLDFNIPKSTGYAWADERLKQQNKALEEFKKVKTKVDTEVKKIQKKHNVSESTAREVYKRQQGLSEQQQPEEVRQYTPQSTLSKVKEIALNPMTAAGYKVRNEDIPENFSRSEDTRNNLDTAVDFINPAWYAESAKNFVQNQGQVFSDVSEGNFQDAALNQTMAGVEALNFIPLVKGTSPLLNKGLKQLGNIKTSVAPELRQGLQTNGIFSPEYLKGLKITATKKLFDSRAANTEENLKRLKLLTSPKTLKAIGNIDAPIADKMLYDFMVRRGDNPSVKQFRTDVKKATLEANRIKKLNPEFDFSPDIFKHPDLVNNANDYLLSKPEYLSKFVNAKKAAEKTIANKQNVKSFLEKEYVKKIDVINQDPILKNIAQESPQYVDAIYNHLKNPNKSTDEFVNDLIKQSNTFTRSMHKSMDSGQITKVDFFTPQGRSMGYTGKNTIDVEGFPTSDARGEYGNNKYKIFPNEERMIDIASTPLEERWAKRFPNTFAGNENIDFGLGMHSNVENDFLHNAIVQRRIRNNMLVNSGSAPIQPKVLKSDIIPYKYLYQPKHVVFNTPEQGQLIKGFDVEQVSDVWNPFKPSEKFGLEPGYTHGFKYGGIIKDNRWQWDYPGKITQIAQEGKEITVDEGNGKKRKILTDSKEYADLYNEDRIGVQNDDGSISFNPFNEVVVTPYDKQYPFYQELSDEEKKYFNDDTPIGRAVRRKAYTKNSLSEDVTDIAAPILYGTAAAMLAPYVLAPLAGGLEFAGAAAAPYIEGALATSLPGMSSIPGATVGNAINAGFAGHGLYNIAPDAVEMYNNPSWSNAGNVGMDVLEIAPVAGPAGRMIGEGISTIGRMPKQLPGSSTVDYANPIKDIVTTFKNRNKKLVTVGAENLDKELLRKIEQLESPEGFSRLVAQEAEMLKRDFPLLERIIDVEKKAVSNAHTRISELYQTALQGNFNRNYLEAKKLNPGLTPKTFGIPTNNAFFRQGLGSRNYSDNAINISKEPSLRDNVFSNTYYNAELPGEIAIGREYAEAMPVYDHEINHALQNSRNTTLDDLLRKYFNNSENLSKNLSEKTKKAYNYFRKNKAGMPSREPSSFLAEARRSMLERGLINDIYEPMTPKKVFEAMKHFKNEPFINPYTEQSYHRIFDFADDHPKTLKFLSDSFNKLLTLGPIGLGAASQMGEEELVPGMKEGGEYFMAQEGKETKPWPSYREFLESIKEDNTIDYKKTPRREIVVESSKTVTPKLPKKLTKEQAKIVQKKRYEEPFKPEGITSGDKTVDFLYNNEWLMDVPILGDYIKDKAKEIAKNSGGRQVVDDIEKKAGATAFADELGYTGNFGIDPNNPDGATLLDQYFSKDALLPKSKYKPTNDYLEFLPSYSIKSGFNQNPKQIEEFNNILNSNVDPYQYKEFLKNKKPIYLDEGIGLKDLLGVDLGGYKTGIGWDDKMSLPYLSISDAWDFEPSHYSEKWTEEGATKGKKDKAFIQSYLMHKAGNPFKIYDRFYFNPETKKYIKDDAIGFQDVYVYKEGGEPSTQNTTTPSPLVEYVVKKGDTLSKIAAANNTSIASIMRNNESISDPNIISVNQKINLIAKNSNTPKEEVYRDWNTIRDKKDKINKLSDEQKIVSYYNDKPEDTYLIVDKKNAVMKLYTGGNLTKSFEVGVGQNPGDAQTVTKVKNGKTDWSAGNKSTGAGIYTISNINPASTEYYNEPAFNLKNENGIEVATTIHGTPKPRRIKFNNGTVVDNRMSNGCINGKCEDLKELYGQLDLNTKVYILPEDAGNNFQIIDGKPALRVSSKNRQRYNQYIDQTGTKQKGQGANQTTNTLVYKPIKAYIDETKFKNDVFQWNDFNDEKEYNNTTKPFIVALTTRKQDVMKAAKISSDVYNELAKMSFGIYGAESNYGDTHSAAGNLARAANKVLDPKSSSSPDYKSKATTYGANENTRSVGLTQIRWNYLNEDEKKALKEVGITSNKDFLDPKKAAIGTVTILGVRYNQQLNDKQKQDLWTYLPTKWNSRSNYSSRVKSNASYLSFKQLDKKQEGGESKPGPLMQAYNSLLTKKKIGGDIPNKKEFGGQLNSGNISMYKDYIKGNVSNEEQAIKNYDKLNRIYYSKAKELGMTAANYIMTYL